ncbi:DUF2339 domain-containing protein [Corynebacterium faecale]|uniref:DUF2339 domain-containing protein n=1 Tax=Corynebacterium faecale TaxID=1758466 RepID=UPI0025B5BA86|nr:DUF2339 domain-containing protein [Corynebacterium faecale]
MDFNQRDRMALRAALEKLSASASAMADASRDINNLVSRMEAPPAEPTPALIDASSAPSRDEPISATPVVAPERLPLPRQVPSALGRVVTRPDTWGTPTPKEKVGAPAVALKPYPRPQRPTKPTTPPMTTEEKIMRGVAIGGAAITIAGIILLVSVAIQRGWLGPLGRVMGAYLLGALLFGAATWLRKRGTRVEAIIALVVTSQIAFIATTSALIFVLNWWPPGLGSLVILLTNMAFLGVTAVWSGLGGRSADSESRTGQPVLLAVAIVTALTAWFFAITEDAWWPIFGVVSALLLSYTVADARIRTSMALMGAILQVILISSWHEMILPAACVGIITPVLLVVLTLWDPVKPQGENPQDVAMTHYWRSFETDPVASWVGVVAPVPIVACLAVPLIRLDAVWFTVLPAALIAAMGIWAVLTSRPAAEPDPETDSLLYAEAAPAEYQRIARLIAVMGLTLVAAIFVGIRYNGPIMEPGAFFDGALPVVIYLITGSTLFMWLRTLPADRNLGVVPWVAWMLGAVIITGVLFRNVITLAPVWLTDTSALIQAVLILVFIGATVLARESFYDRELWLQLLVGATLLYLSATAIVTITTFLGNLIGGTTGMHLGFLVGHASVSILWMVIAAFLMLHRGLLLQPGALWTGVGLAVAGTVKLVFFDLVALSGVPRAIAFLLSGLALLTIASLRGRRTGELTPEKETDAEQVTVT